MLIKSTTKGTDSLIYLILLHKILPTKFERFYKVNKYDLTLLLRMARFS